MRVLSRILLGLLTVFGVVAGGLLSLNHLQTSEVCPKLGSLPACFLVLAGYSFMLAGVVTFPKKIATKLFMAGAIPVLLLALMGVLGEIFIGQVCPPGGFGIPQCFYSLGLVSLCIGLFLFMRRGNTI